MQSEDIFTARIDTWFAERSALIRARERKQAANKTGATEFVEENAGGKLEFGVSKIVRSIADHEAERRKRSAARSRA